MSSTILTTISQKYNSAKQLQKDIASGNDNYYFVFGNHDPNITSIPSANADLYSTISYVYNNMIAGKRISNSNILPAIRRISYTSNTVYAMYDDADINLQIKDFYAVTNEGSYSHVYKCLDNNQSNVSTVQPQFAQVSGSNSYVYQTSDGYRWKYMFSVDSGTLGTFGTDDYFPVLANSAVSGNAMGGCVDVIAVTGSGQKYDNYITGTLSTSQIKVGGNNLLYQISNSVASLVPNFYAGCLMYLSTGTGAGGYSTIEAYISNTSGNYVVLQNALSTSPTNGTGYQIYPQVRVHGTGPHLVNCVARALVNSLSTNSVYRVEVLNRGSGYNIIYDAEVYADPSVNVLLPAELHPINSPAKGHGHDAAAELFSNSLLLSVKLSNSENGTIPASNYYKQIGLIKNPVFANVAVEFNNHVGVFSIGEPVYAVNTIQLQNNVSLNTSSNVVTCTTADFVNQLGSDAQILLKTAESDTYQLATINSITNSSQIVLTTNGFFTCSAAVAYKVTIAANSYAQTSNNTHLLLSNVEGYFTKNSQLVGNSTGSYTVVNSMLISDVNKTLDTFIEAYKYQGTVVSGTLQPNELLQQTNGFSLMTYSSLVHSTNVSGANITIYTTQQNDNFAVGGTNTAVGNVSGAEVQLNSFNESEVVFGTGSVVYYENVSPVTRTSNTSETVQFTISF
jgi:hypothetical protein